MNKKIELLMRKHTLKDLELWLYRQYVEIEDELRKIEKAEKQESKEG